MTDVTGNPEEERRTEFYQGPWVPEAVSRYVFSKVMSLMMRFHWAYVMVFIWRNVVLVLGAAEKTWVGAGPWYPTHLRQIVQPAIMLKQIVKHAAFFKSLSQEGCVVHERGNLRIVSAAHTCEHTHTSTHLNVISLLRLDIVMSCGNDVWFNGAACVITGARNAFSGP